MRPWENCRKEAKEVEVEEDEPVLVKRKVGAVLFGLGQQAEARG